MSRRKKAYTGQAVPDGTSRLSPVFWQKMIDSSYKRREKVNSQGARFSRWDGGDLRDVVDPSALSQDYPRWQSGLENMHSLAVTAAQADLLFRCPRPQVRTPYVASPPPMPQPGMPLVALPLPNLFTAKLARCETAYLVYLTQRVKHLSKCSRALQDALNFDMGIAKVSADPDVAIDEDVMQAAQAEALEEMRLLMEQGVLPVAKEGQVHSVHVRVKTEFLRQADQGTPAWPVKLKKYLRKHVAVHESMKRSERPTETIRSNQIRLKRVNPLDYFYDPTVDDLDDASWKGHRYLMRRADVLGNESYDPDARAQVQVAQDRWIMRASMPTVDTRGSFDVPEDMVMVNEVYDFVDQVKLILADGVPIPLLWEPRGDLASLQPSGPFHEIVFKWSSLEAQGVPVACGYEAEQAAMTHIASANVQAAVQSSPRSMYNSRLIDQIVAERIWKASTAEFIPVDMKDPSKPLEDAFAQVPAVEIPEQNMAVKQDCVHGVERRSGLGVAKMGGGETSPTATGAALGADAATSISEDRGAKVDAWQTGIYRDYVRLTRAFTPKSQIVEVCGDEAIDAWPDPPNGSVRSFSTVDACNDIAVDVVAGSSRRRNTSVDQKQLLDGITGLGALPMMQGPAGQGLLLQMARMFFEDGGVTGLDWGPVEQEVAMMGMMQQQQAMMQPPGGPQDAQEGAGGAEPDQDDSNVVPGPGAAPRPSPTPVSANDQAQGVQNVAGGRVGTGASVGDKIRQYRGDAVGRVQNRG